MDFMSIKEASKLWGIDTSRIGRLAREGRIAGAKIVGRNWLIPKNAKKPTDGRFKNSEINASQDYFRFPLFVALDVNAFEPPLSKEEKSLRNAQISFYSCDFEKALTEFEILSDKAESVYVKITALYFMCMLSAAYDYNIKWDKYYNRFNLLLSQDFPYKKEMELFRPLLNFFLGLYISASESFEYDDSYDYHPSVYCMCEYLSILQNQRLNSEEQNSTNFVAYEMMCRQMELHGYFYEAQCVHRMLFVYYFILQNEVRMQHHLKCFLTIAYEHKLFVEVADLEPYYPKEFESALRAFPPKFAEKIRYCGKQIFENYMKFSNENELLNLYSNLSKNDFIFVLYSTQGYSNKQIAVRMHVSERTVANKLSEIYEKIGVKGKKELLNFIVKTL